MLKKGKRKKQGDSRKKKKIEIPEDVAEEVIIRCANCGREIRVVKKRGYSTEGILCQRCAMGEVVRDG